MDITKFLRVSKKRDLSDQSDGGEQQEKASEGSLEENPEVDSVLQLVWIHQNLSRYCLIACKTLRKVLRKYMKCRKRLKAHKLKVNCSSRS